MTHPDVGVHTRGRLTVFEAFFVLRDGNPFKRNQRAKIRNPSGQDSRGSESPQPLSAAALAPALFILARSHCVASPRPLVDGETSREPGHWPAPEHCGSGATTSQKRRKPKRNLCHSSPVCEVRHCAFRRPYDFDGPTTRFDAGKDQGQLGSDQIPTTSAGDCHALPSCVAPAFMACVRGSEKAGARTRVSLPLLG